MLSNIEEYLNKVDEGTAIKLWMKEFNKHKKQGISFETYVVQQKLLNKNIPFDVSLIKSLKDLTSYRRKIYLECKHYLCKGYL